MAKASALRSSIVAMVATVALGVSACGGATPSGTSETSTASTSTEGTASAEPSSSSKWRTPKPRPAKTSPEAVESNSVFAIAGTLPITDEDGYTYELEYSAESRSGFTGDISQAKPGMSNIVNDATSSATLTNTTPGRDAVGQGISFVPYAFYTADSLPCTTEGVALRSISIGETGQISHCAVPIAPALHNMEPTLAQDGSRELQPNTIAGVNSFNEMSSLPEEDVPAVLEALNSPLTIMLFVSTTENPYDAPMEVQVPGSCDVSVGNPYNEGTDPNMVVPAEGYDSIC